MAKNTRFFAVGYAIVSPALFTTHAGMLRRLTRWRRSIRKRLGRPDQADIYRKEKAARRRELQAKFEQECQNIVQQGVFGGMILPQGDEGASKTSKLLGLYESELYPTLEAIAAAGADTIINVGCGAGYFAVGLAQLIPHSTVLAFDLDAKARMLCAKAARLNGVSDRVSVEGECDAKRLYSCIEGSERPFLLIDCEGGERDLLLDNPSAFTGCIIVVECHDFIDRSITPRINAAFAATHLSEFIEQGGRNPNASPLLRDWHERDRWLAVCEYRPEVMHWLVLKPRPTLQQAPSA